MNHYPHHLGDYAKDTLGLSMLEHGAYRLLLDAYYATEEAPAAEDVYAITKAGTPAERKAVEKVLRKFELRDGRYYHKRVEEELEAYRERSKAAADKAAKRWKKDAQPNAPAMPRHMPQHQPEHMPQQSPGNAQPILASSHKPVVNPKPPSEKRIPGGDTTPDSAATAAAAALEKLKAQHPPVSLEEARIPDNTPAAVLSSVCIANGVSPATPFHPLIVEWARTGVTPERLKGAIATARLRKPQPTKIPPAYLDTILADAGAPKADSRWRTDDAECERMARNLGLWPARAKESWQELRGRIAEALHNEARSEVR